MLKLIHADFYKVFHRLYFYILTVVLAGLCFITIFAMKGSCASQSIKFAIAMFSMPVFILPMVTQIVFSEEYQSHTLKNTASYGTDRTVLFISKWITSILLSAILAAVLLAVYMGGTMLILKRDAAFNSALIQEFFTRLGAACSVYIACISMSVFLAAVFNRNGFAIFLYYALFYFTGYLLLLFRLGSATKYLLKYSLDAIMQNPATQLQQPVVVSLVTAVAFFVGGAVLFRRKDLC